MVEAAGVRVRYPLLDRDLVDFTTTIPPTLKVKWGQNRYIFKRAMEGFLPQAIIQKKKHNRSRVRWFRGSGFTEKGMRIERFEDIEAWQLARELTRKVYGLTRKASNRSRVQRFRVHRKSQPFRKLNERKLTLNGSPR